MYFSFISIYISKSNISANNLFARGQVDPVLAVGRVRGSCVGGGGEAHDVIVTSELLRIQYLPKRALQVGLHCWSSVNSQHRARKHYWLSNSIVKFNVWCFKLEPEIHRIHKFTSTYTNFYLLAIHLTLTAYLLFTSKMYNTTFSL